MSFLLLLVAWVVMLGISLAWPRRENRPRPVGMWFVLALPVIFLGHWQAAGLMISGATWLYWLGDNETWLWNVVGLFVHVFAGGVTALIAARVMLWRAGPRYAALNTIGPAIWLATFLSYDYLREVEGVTAQSAARHISARHIFAPNERSLSQALVLRREEPEPTFKKETCRTFLVSDHTGPRCRVTVCRHGPFWKDKVIDVFPAREFEIVRAKESLLFHPERAPLFLQRIIKNYPGTPEAEEARRILDEVHGVPQ